MFLLAGFNPFNFDTGIRAYTRPVGRRDMKFKLAQLRRWTCGDYFWYRPSVRWHGRIIEHGFIVWPDTVEFDEPVIHAMVRTGRYDEIEVQGCNIENRREGRSLAPFLTDG